MTSHKCLRCNKETNNKKFCSISCSSKGHKVSEESRKKIGQANKGENNGMWECGEFAYQRIAREVYPNKCCMCNSNLFLCVHHIDGDRKNNILENLCIVCKSCHAKIHNIQENINGKKDSLS